MFKHYYEYEFENKILSCNDQCIHLQLVLSYWNINNNNNNNNKHLYNKAPNSTLLAQVYKKQNSKSLMQYMWNGCQRLYQNEREESGDQ